jgi:hypothetical protein
LIFELFRPSWHAKTSPAIATTNGSCSNPRYVNAFECGQFGGSWLPSGSDASTTNTGGSEDDADGVTTPAQTAGDAQSAQYGKQQAQAGSSWMNFVVTPEEIVRNTTMTSYAQMLFYHASPEIVSEDKFKNENYCGSNQDAEKRGASEVLGCYIASKAVEREYKDGGVGLLPSENDVDYIFIREFSDANLLPEMNVTSAHEMLHAGWTHFPWNLYTNQKDIIDELNAFYTNNQELQMRMMPYVDSGLKENSAEFLDELHSIIGTEFSDIGTKLENYYKIYFDNRIAVVRDHQGVRCYLGQILCF